MLRASTRNIGMLRIEINDAEVSAALGRIAAALTDMTPVMQDIGEALVEETKQRFARGEDPDGAPWVPKSPATIDAYRARGDSVSFRPLIGPTRALSTTIHYLAGADRVEVGSGRIQAAVMQAGAAKGAFGRTSRGSPIPWGNIPARPFIGLSATDRDNILDIVDEWLERAAGGSAV